MNSQIGTHSQSQLQTHQLNRQISLKHGRRLTELFEEAQGKYRDESSPSNSISKYLTPYLRPNESGVTTEQ